MKRILSTLLLLIISVSCNFGQTKKAPPLDISDSVYVVKMTPEPFIPELPYELNENSGLILYDGLLWSFNDSGGENKIFGFDFSGNIQKEIEIENAENYDWEEIAQDNKHIYVGDFGNNNGHRKNLKIYKVKKDNLNKKSGKVKADVIQLNYADQMSFDFSMQQTEFDCEAMAVFGDHLYLFTKNWKNQTTTVYKVPTMVGEYSIEPLEKFSINGLVTGADFSRDEKRLAIIGYRDYVPFLWLFEGFEKDHFFSGEKTFVLMDSIVEAQTEGVCFLNNAVLLISCEETNAFIQQVFLFNTITMKLNGTYQGEPGN
ncbi:MAG: hypothetical protein JXR61_02730 [Prolixibacteraceae bacterium]|nr:hypothetical protein [Prolixibacteraceae bacterium]